MNTQDNAIASQPINQQTASKYGIFQSLNHMMGAIKRNPTTFIVSVALSYLLSGIVLYFSVLGLASLLFGQFGLLFASASKILLVLIVSVLVYTVLYAFIYAFTIGCIAYSLNDQKLGLSTVIKMSAKSTLRLFKVNAWVAIFAYWPIAIAAFLPLLLLSNINLNNSVFAILVPALIIAALIWAIIAHLRYALAPYVSLFEPDVSARQALARSQQLLKNGGQLFVFKGVLIIIALIIILSLVTGSNISQLENSKDITTNLIIILLAILIEGAMVMLYFNRTNKQNNTNFPKSVMLTVLTVLLLVGMYGFAAISSNKNTFEDSLSGADREYLTQLSSESNLRPAEQIFVNPVDGSKTDIKKGNYYAVTVGDVQYFGQVSKINDDYVRLLPTAYKKGNTLTFTGKELHGPEAATYFRVSNIKLFQELTDLTILEAVKSADSTVSDSFPSKDINRYTKSGQFQAFYFTDGTAYFAKTMSLEGAFLASSSHVYVLRTNSSSNSGVTDISLVLAEPKQYNKRVATDLLYWQNMKQDSQISIAASEFEKNQ